MIIVMKLIATLDDVKRVVDKVKFLGFEPHITNDDERTLIRISGDDRQIDREQINILPNVEAVVPTLKPYKLVSREWHLTDTVVDVDGIKVGGKDVVVMAGPCSVENEEQLLTSAKIVREAGIKVLRGGAFKPRTSPYTFQGLGEEGLKILAKAKRETGLKIVTEVMDDADVNLVAEYADILQIGSRNMQNIKLLRAVSKIRKPVLLKRGFSATLTEFLMSAEYLLDGGNDQIILCERGIRTFVEYTRNTLDLNIIPAIKRLSHLPIIVDPSHGTGRYDFIIPMSRASIAAGADGLLVEMHPKPEDAISDGAQSLKPEKLFQLINDLKQIAAAVGRNLI
ncbi:MAG: 3-deoxy-7-phosphoheptulonate synthase [Bacteroidota bacterium]|nr:3-deoxy-7-phosphoheptulonate synthase [Bacteroidota bacterium]